LRSLDPDQLDSHIEGHMSTATDSHLTLRAETAADLMCRDVTPVAHDALFEDILATLIDANATVAPVVGTRGEPVGVISLTDLAIHVRESSADGRIAPATAESLMTPTLFAVGPDTLAAEIVQDMLRSKVHHLFVTDEGGTIMGVVSTCDVLRHLH
jgi:CBS-domain-containing membrane protein